jgi:hypothetical protein
MLLLLSRSFATSLADVPLSFDADEMASLDSVRV